MTKKTTIIGKLAAAFAIVALVLVSASCNKAELSKVATSDVANITDTTATCSGDVKFGGNDSVTARGVCWSTKGEPTTSNSHTTDGAGTGTFNSEIGGLEPGTTYYIRAYATNSVGTAYGETKTFTTTFTAERIITANGVSFTMKAVAGGSFKMGATGDLENDADNDELPAHDVALNNFYMGETEVTQALWQAVMGNNPSKFQGDDLPVERVSREDCDTFVARLNKITGLTFRLPTEAEWEYAARGGSQSQGFVHSGSNTLDDVAWHKKNSGGKTHPVKTKQPNELGIYDMSGNVWEWCFDWYEEYSEDSRNNPAGPEMGENHTFRGGCWKSETKRCRVSFRNQDRTIKTGTSECLGLRLVLATTSDNYLNYTPKPKEPEESTIDSDDNDITADIDDDDDEEVKSGKSSENWDKVLDDYESYVDSYLKLYKKAMDGDASAMSEYINMLDKAQSFQRKLEKAGDDLSISQMNRLNKISLKMAKEAEKIANSAKGKSASFSF